MWMPSTVQHDMTHPHLAWHSMAWPSLMWHGTAQLGTAQSCRVLLLGKAQHGSTWHSMACTPRWEGAHSAEVGGQQVPGDPLCAHFGHASSGGAERSPHRDTPATAALRPRARATQGDTFCGNKGDSVLGPRCHPAPPSWRHPLHHAGTSILVAPLRSCLTGALFSAAGDKLCRGWGQEAAFGSSSRTLPVPEQAQAWSGRPRLGGHGVGGGQTHTKSSAKSPQAPSPPFCLPCTSHRAAPWGSRGRAGSGASGASGTGGRFGCFLFWFG